MNKDLKKLRGSLDGNDKFIQGYQIGKPRTYARKIPTWARNKTEIRKILLRAFPKLNTSSTQRAAAGRWSRAIYLYFSLGYTRKQTAAEMGLTQKATQRILDRISLVFKGLRKARGRPKNSGV